jgi:hypothetical protein
MSDYSIQPLGIQAWGIFLQNNHSTPSITPSKLPGLEANPTASTSVFSFINCDEVRNLLLFGAK